MSARIFKSTVEKRTISMTGGINSSATILTLDSGSTLPTTYPYTLVIDPDLSTEEIVTVTSSTGVASQLNITRGQDGSTAQAHSNGSVVRHMITGRDLGEAQAHIEATGSYSITNNGENPAIVTPTITKTLHGIAAGEGAVVGTLKAQTLTSKTLTSPVINTPTISAPTVTNGTFSAPAVSSGTFATPAITGGTITGSSLNLSGGGSLAIGTSSTALTANGRTITAVEVSALSGLGTWTSYTPALGGSGTISLGNGTISGLYTQIGKIVNFKITVTYGSTSSFGTGLTVSLPSTPSTTGVGQCISQQSSAYYGGEALILTDATVTPLATPATASGASRSLTTLVPITWTTNNKLYISGTYEVA